MEEIAKYTYPTQLTNSFDRENWTVSTDHCYARPWNWRPDASFLRPTKTLFVRKLIPEKPKMSNSLDSEEIIDVVTDPEIPAPVYDENKARNMMEECEKYAFSARVESEEGWDEKIPKINWNPCQYRVFNSIANILDSFNLAKLAQTGLHNEPLLRRNVIDKAVQRVRRLLASIFWDPKLTHWLHNLLIDNLGPYYLACYLDILQTLRSKLPGPVDKMMSSPSSSLRMGSLNNASLTPLLEKTWDPLASSLMQDKPKKLPGNPIIVIVPTGPVISKMLHKWIKLLSHLATVVTIPTNFGLSAHRMALPSILDQLFSVTRGKIQDVRQDYPGRHIILVGFGSGASLALQVAQTETVLCVISVGFSLLTAEGSRGEPDDNLLELQCPVLFVIGQSSNTSTQEDLEDLRERMRVETGLLVVGAADDNLRVDKKKKNAEGITQSVMDRCIVDEVGEFISGIILSPYPPQIRQSPTHVPPEIPVKKGKPERKRYNSNTSSLDSEPPSPKPRSARPVGRPPGSKTKNRLGLEAKWAQQIAQARMQAYGLNRSIMQGNTSNLSTLLQGGIKTIPPSQPKPSSSGIKGGHQSMNNVLLMPDGKLKSIPGSTVRGTGGTPILLPISPQKGPPKPNRTKFITAKRQLVSHKPPRSMKNPLFAPPPNVHPSLPPPTNLTTEDIMDLPIIFADDNQMLDTSVPGNLASTPSTPAPTTSVPSTAVPKLVQPLAPKYMLINKQSTSQGNFVFTPTIRKPTALTFHKPTPKYTKIILSSKRNAVEELKTNPKIQCLSPEITVKKILTAQGHVTRSEPPPVVELIDLENEIKATAVPKPNLSTSDIKNIKIIPKNAGERFEMAFAKSGGGISGSKRPASMIEVLDDGDPDYIPPKNLKLE